MNDFKHVRHKVLRLKDDVAHEFSLFRLMESSSSNMYIVYKLMLYIMKIFTIILHCRKCLHLYVYLENLTKHTSMSNISWRVH